MKLIGMNEMMRLVIDSIPILVIASIVTAYLHKGIFYFLFIFLLMFIPMSANDSWHLFCFRPKIGWIFYPEDLVV